MTVSISVSGVIQHLLFVMLLLLAPAWDFYDTSRLKRDPTSARKIRYYRTLCTWLWISTAIAIASVGFRSSFIINPTPAEIPWLVKHAWVVYLVEAVIALFLAVMLLPLVIVIRKKIRKQPRTYSSAAALESMSYFLPATRAERRWYVLLCISAGICEEILFRGFLLRYLHIFPWTLNLTLALLIAAVIFGLQHLYQGAGGAASSVIIGFLFSLLFLLSGSLLLPMIFHAVMDLRVLWLLRPPAS